MDSKKRRPILFMLIYILSVSLFLLTILRGYAIAGQQVRLGSNDLKASDSYALDTLNTGWILTRADGSSETVTLPCSVPNNGVITITRDVTGLLRSGWILKFDNMRQGLIVTADGQTVYEVNTTKLRNQLSFTDNLLVVLPDAENTREVSIRFVHSPSGNYNLPSVSIGSYYCAGNEILRNEILTLVLLVVLALFLCFVAGIMVYCLVHKIDHSQSFDLFFFVLTTIFWGYTDSYLPVLTEIPQEVLGLICYLSIMALPLPMCHFVWISLGKRHSVFQIISGIGAANLILQSLLSIFGVIQLQNTFYAAHILIIAVIIAAMVCLYRTRREAKTNDMDLLYMGFVLLAAMALASILLYWQKGGLYYRICLLTGILVFSGMLTAYVIVRYLHKLQANQLKLSEIKIQERLSLYDELTGLPNRRAFESKLKEVESRIEELDDAVLMMLDVNGLKLVNDRYGHSAGDDLIVSAARAVEMTYGAEGSCFRIGGDEFVVILLDLSVPMSIYDKRFEENIAAINEGSRWKLSIAKGISHLSHDFGQKLTISDWKQEADVNMYRSKISMAGNNSRDRAKDLTDIINCIISTVEAKDMYTAAHSDRVRELSYCIAANLGVSDSTLQNLETAAHLHDIGKIGIPDYILLKPGRLTDEEYGIIQRHCQIGAGIISHAKGMQEVANIVLHHHERWDGKGYPENLSREDIPLESRIIALADSIDALTSKRVYRDSMPLDQCREEISRNAGLMYDPAITKIVLEHWNDIVDIVMLHPKRLISGDAGNS